MCHHPPQLNHVHTLAVTLQNPGYTKLKKQVVQRVKNKEMSFKADICSEFRAALSLLKGEEISRFAIQMDVLCDESTVCYLALYICITGLTVWVNG